jgi:hypothetical protein
VQALQASRGMSSDPRPWAIAPQHEMSPSRYGDIVEFLFDWCVQTARETVRVNEVLGCSPADVIVIDLMHRTAATSGYPTNMACGQVRVTPLDKLTFELGPARTMSRAVLAMSNSANASPVAFKIKTTQPKR